MANKTKEYRIDGCIIDWSGNSNEDTVLDEFIEWIESKGWEFGGGFEDITNKEYKDD
jgi:hypothetical protein